MSEPGKKEVTFEDLERRHLHNFQSAYFNWIKNIVSLSVGSLTALIALQGNYLSNSPQLPIFLGTCWSGLLLSILLGVKALWTEAGIHLDQADQIRTMRAQHGDAYTASYLEKNGGVGFPRSHLWSVRLMVASFVLSLVSLCIFAVVNLLFKN